VSVKYRCISTTELTALINDVMPRVIGAFLNVLFGKIDPDLILHTIHDSGIMNIKQ
jgi:hypothetical protein